MQTEIANSKPQALYPNPQALYPKPKNPKPLALDPKPLINETQRASRGRSRVRGAMSAGRRLWRAALFRGWATSTDPKP
jgi:hypothetical protein